VVGASRLGPTWGCWSEADSVAYLFGVEAWGVWRGFGETASKTNPESPFSIILQANRKSRWYVLQPGSQSDFSTPCADGSMLFETSVLYCPP